MTDEIWKDITGYEGSYQVSNHGRVRSLDRDVSKIKKRKGQIMKLVVHTGGYQVVWLAMKGTKKKFFIHRLVATEFLQREDHHEQVNHKDKNRLHNHVRNLEWCTWEENYKHRDGVYTDEPF